jgi:hypothetical protein
MVVEEVLGQTGYVILDEAVEDPIGLFLPRKDNGIIALDVEHLDVEARPRALNPDANGLIPGLAFLIMT